MSVLHVVLPLPAAALRARSRRFRTAPGDTLSRAASSSTDSLSFGGDGLSPPLSPVSPPVAAGVAAAAGYTSAMASAGSFSPSHVARHMTRADRYAWNSQRVAPRRTACASISPRAFSASRDTRRECTDHSHGEIADISPNVTAANVGRHPAA